VPFGDHAEGVVVCDAAQKGNKQQTEIDYSCNYVLAGWITVDCAFWDEPSQMWTCNLPS
jgi:hypothetical protein